MDSVGLVEFNKNRGIIEPSPALAEVDIYIDVVRGNEIPWSEYYLGLTAVCGALVAAVWAGAYPFALISEFSWMVFMVIAFGFSSVAHIYYSNKSQIGQSAMPKEAARMEE